MMFWSCSAGNKLSFRNGNNIRFRTSTKKITIYDTPDGYNHNEIRFIKGHKTLMIITYRDSSILYISDDLYDIPNRENVERLHTIESVWRIHSELLMALKENCVSVKQNDNLFLDYGFSYSELYNYERPTLVDLHGKCGGMAWRDVMFKDICMGHITQDPSMVKLFDQCIEITMLKIRNS